MLAKLGLWFWPSCTRKPLPILNSLPTSYFLCFICCLWRKKNNYNEICYIVSVSMLPLLDYTMNIVSQAAKHDIG